MPPLSSSDYRAPDTSFRKRPIGTLDVLARMLRWKGCTKTAAELCLIADQASSLYRIAGRKKKTDGSVRVLLDATFPLKSIQGRIQAMILKNVAFPPYLQGSVKGRGQASNAREHVGQRLIITEDIKDFFPTISTKIVFRIWHRFFCFPPDVAECLTKLTTRDGCLPQGAKTSPLLANLVFWEHEAAFVRTLERKGVKYTRLVDDITCSSARDLSRDEISGVIRRLRHFVSSFGFQLKRKKETVAHNSKPMIATQLLVNKKLSLPEKQRSKIRAAVHSFVKAVDSNNAPSDRTFNRVSGQLAYLTQHHPGQGAEMREALRRARKKYLKRR